MNRVADRVATYIGTGATRRAARDTHRARLRDVLRAHLWASSATRERIRRRRRGAEGSSPKRCMDRGANGAPESG
ncbi:MAG: hypothetical protein ACLT98_05415 [Eggerthellaceae bacterium]